MRTKRKSLVKPGFGKRAFCRTHDVEFLMCAEHRTITMTIVSRQFVQILRVESWLDETNGIWVHFLPWRDSESIVNFSQP